jgi:D-amino-acid dehydrogenase
MEFAGDAPRFDPRRVEAVVASLRRYLDLRWDEQFEPWAGSRPMSPDGLPYLGRTARWSNLVVAAGHGMYGLTLAAPSAAAVAALIAGDAAAPFLAPFSPDR